MSSFRRLLFVYVCCFLCFTVDWTSALPYGAPLEACATMKPLHLFPPQPDPSPFVIETQSEISGESFEVTLKSPSGVNFRGFLLMAFDNSTSDDLNPIGHFVTDSLGLSQHLECGNPQGALTHTNPKEKSSIKATWYPPDDYEGFIVFKATFVKNFSEYWVKQRSAVTEVNSTSQEHSTHAPFDFHETETTESSFVDYITTEMPKVIDKDSSFAEDHSILENDMKR